MTLEVEAPSDRTQVPGGQKWSSAGTEGSAGRTEPQGRSEPRPHGGSRAGSWWNEGCVRGSCGQTDPRPAEFLQLGRISALLSRMAPVHPQDILVLGQHHGHRDSKRHQGGTLSWRVWSRPMSQPAGDPLKRTWEGGLCT